MLNIDNNAVAFLLHHPVLGYGFSYAAAAAAIASARSSKSVPGVSRVVLLLACSFGTNYQTFFLLTIYEIESHYSNIWQVSDMTLPSNILAKAFDKYIPYMYMRYIRSK